LNAVQGKDEKRGKAVLLYSERVSQSLTQKCAKQVNYIMNKKQNLYVLGDYNTRQIKYFAKVLELQKMSARDYYNFRPDAVPDYDKYIQNMHPEVAESIIPDAFAGRIGIELVKNMNTDQLEAIGSGSDAFLKLAVKNAFYRLSSAESTANTKQLRDYFDYSPAWQM